MSKKRDENVVFRRINGRIVPIKKGKKGTFKPKKVDTPKISYKKRPKQTVKKSKFKLSNNLIGIGTTVGAYGEAAEYIQMRRLKASASISRQAISFKDWAKHKDAVRWSHRNVRWLGKARKVTKIGLAITIGGLILKGFDK